MSSSPSSTRQQLDELDALLQKMLNLPLSQVEEVPATLPPPPPPRRSITPPPEATIPAPPLDLPSTARFAPPEEPVAPPPAFRTMVPPQVPTTPPPMTFSGRPLNTPAESPHRSPEPPMNPPPPPETVFDSSWKVEIPGTPLPPPNVFRGWTTDTDPLAGPPRHPKPAPSRFTTIPHDEPLPSESQIIDFRSPLSQADPEPVHPSPPTYVHERFSTIPPAPAPAQAVNEPIAAASTQPMPSPAVNPPPVTVIRWDGPATWKAVPLYWFNAGADLVLRQFGGPGRFLTTRLGRNLLGWTGILLCVAAVGLGIKDYLRIDWTP